MTWALESFNNFHFNGLLLSKVYIVQVKKVQRSYLSWNWRGIHNLKKNRLAISKLHKEFDKFWPDQSKISKCFTLMGFFWAKYIFFEPTKYVGVSFHETEEGCKIWRGIDLSFQDWHKEYDKFWHKHSKSERFLL